VSREKSVRTPGTPSALAQRPLVANCRVCALRDNAAFLCASILAGVATIRVKNPLPLLKGFRRRNGPRLPPHLVPYAERRMEIKA
jgi:hypothetical protein